MKQAHTVQLSDPAVYPDAMVLRKTLGSTYTVYRKLMDIFAKHGLTSEWRYYHDGKSWLCKVQRKTKTIVWMSARDGYFRATLYFAPKYSDGIYELDIPDDEKKRICETRNTGKSKPCTFDVKTGDILPVIEKVIEYKISCK